MAVASARGVSCEPLEGRELFAAFVVTNVNDAGAGSLRQAILSANPACPLDRAMLARREIGLVVASVVCFLAVLMAWYGVNFVLGKDSTRLARADGVERLRDAA